MTEKKIGSRKADNVIPLKASRGNKKPKAAEANGSVKPEPTTNADNIADAPKATEEEIKAAELEAELARLAALSPVEYELARKEATKRFNIRVALLDELVQRRRPANATEDDGRQGVAVKLEDTKPWPEAIDGETLLREIEAVVHKHVILSEDQGLACALWAIHTHAIDYADHSPRLHFSSPAPACGKTTLLDTIATMVSKPLMTDNITMAAMFRIIDMYHPTLLIDEADSFIRVKGQDNEEVRGLLNGGHSRGGGIIRVVGDDHEVRQFFVWGPVVLASIREIPATVESRSITVHLRRKLPSETTERLPRGRQALKKYGKMIARWVADNGDRLRDADPALPEELGDRERDNWRPLVAIADAISTKVGERVRAAAIAMSNEAQEMAPEEYALTLLADVADIFARGEHKNEKRLGSTMLVEELKKLADRDWAKWGRNRDGLTTTALARMLKPFNIKPRKRQYDREAIEEAYTRYVQRASEPAISTEEEPL